MHFMLDTRDWPDNIQKIKRIFLNTKSALDKWQQRFWRKQTVELQPCCTKEIVRLFANFN